MNNQTYRFATKASTAQKPILKRASSMMTAAGDPVHVAAGLLIARASEFVPREHVEENRLINTVYNDRTIVELSVFLLFQLDFYLSTRNDERRDEKMRKSIRYHADFFNRLFPGSGYDQLLYSRIQLYGEKAHQNKEFMAETLQLLKEVIMDTQKHGKHRIAVLFPYKDDYHLASRLDYHLKLYFDRHRSNLLAIYRTVRES